MPGTSNPLGASLRRAVHSRGGTAAHGNSTMIRVCASGGEPSVNPPRVATGYFTFAPEFIGTPTASVVRIQGTVCRFQDATPWISANAAHFTSVSRKSWLWHGMHCEPKVPFPSQWGWRLATRGAHAGRSFACLHPRPNGRDIHFKSAIDGIIALAVPLPEVNPCPFW